MACHYGNVKMVNFLLKNQAKVNAKTKVIIECVFVCFPLFLCAESNCIFSDHIDPLYVTDCACQGV